MKKTRQSNIELLRILAMVMVMVLHANFETLGYPRPHKVEAEPMMWAGMMLTEELCICCVDVFVLITGWFGVHFRWRNFLRLCFLTLFVSQAMNLAVWAAKGAAPGDWFQLLRASWQYWFIASYLLLYLFTPALNAFVEQQGAKGLQRFLVGFYLFVVPFSYALSDLQRGFSAICFMGLYLLGRYLRLHLAPRLERVPRSRFLWLYFGLSVGMALAYWAHIYFRNPWLPQLPNVVTSYSNPLTILAAACLLLYFSRLQLQKGWVNWLAAGSLAVYLTHQQIFVRPEFFKLLREVDKALPSPLYPLGAAAVLAVVYVASAALGHLAQRCFDLLAAFGEKNLSKQKLRNLLCKVSFSK